MCKMVASPKQNNSLGKKSPPPWNQKYDGVLLITPRAGKLEIYQARLMDEMPTVQSLRPLSEGAKQIPF